MKFHSSNKSNKNLFMKLENTADKTRDEFFFLSSSCSDFTFKSYYHSLYILESSYYRSLSFLKNQQSLSGLFLFLTQILCWDCFHQVFFSRISYSILMDDSWFVSEFEKYKIILCVRVFFSATFSQMCRVFNNIEFIVKSIF